jgi:hypothetical protein
MKFIPIAEKKARGLEFRKYTYTEDGEAFYRMRLTAPDGSICDEIDGVLLETGEVTDGVMGYDSAETCERMKGPFENICTWWWANMRNTLVRDANGEIYLHSYHKNVSDSEYYSRVRTPQELVELLFDELCGEDREVAILEFLKSGHWAVALPEPVRDEITSTASRRRESRRDLIVERLFHREPEEAEPEPDKFTLFLSAGNQSGSYRREIRSLMEKLETERETAAAEPLTCHPQDAADAAPTT